MQTNTSTAFLVIQSSPVRIYPLYTYPANIIIQNIICRRTFSRKWETLLIRASRMGGRRLCGSSLLWTNLLTRTRLGMFLRSIFTVGMQITTTSSPVTKGLSTAEIAHNFYIVSYLLNPANYPFLHVVDPMTVSFPCCILLICSNLVSSLGWNFKGLQKSSFYPSINCPLFRDQTW